MVLILLFIIRIFNNRFSGSNDLSYVSAVDYNEEKEKERHNMRKLIIDTDTGSDDAVALMLALLEESVEVLGITTVCGNVPQILATKNALMTVELCSKEVPVYPGADRPLFRDLVTAVRVHGDDGMGDCDLIHPTRAAEKRHAVNYILDTVRQYPGEIEIVTLGPLTNVALAILQDREAMKGVKHIYTMGTSGFGPGNTTPVASFNVYVDADSFRVLLGAGIPLTIIGFDQCIGESALHKEDLEKLASLNRLGKFAADCNRTLLQYNLQRTGEYMVDLPDAVAMAVALWDDIALERVSVHAYCCTADEVTYGQVIFYDRYDFLSVQHEVPPDNAEVVRKVDEALYKRRLLQALESRQLRSCVQQ